MHLPLHIENPEIIASIRQSELCWNNNFTDAISMFETFLDSNDFPLSYKRRVAFLFTELLQNTQKHSLNLKLSWCWIVKTSMGIEIHSLNPINQANREKINSEFQLLSQFTAEQIKAKIKERIVNNTNGIGLMEIYRKASHFSYHLIQPKDTIYLHCKITHYENA